LAAPSVTLAAAFVNPVSFTYSIVLLTVWPGVSRPHRAATVGHFNLPLLQVRELLVHHAEVADQLVGRRFRLGLQVAERPDLALGLLGVGLERVLDHLE
jgi:hypothetical protein